MKHGLHGLRGFHGALTPVLLICVLGVSAPASAQNPQMQQRRQMLQKQVGERFLQHVTQQLRLDEPTRAKLEQHLRASGQDRQQLARRGAQLRMEMMRAVRDSATSDAEFRRLLADATALRQREEDLWKTDQQALARILTPRQQVQFVFMWMRFTEQIRDVANRPGRQ